MLRKQFANRIFRRAKGQVSYVQFHDTSIFRPFSKPLLGHGRVEASDADPITHLQAIRTEQLPQV